MVEEALTLQTWAATQNDAYTRLTEAHHLSFLSPLHIFQTYINDKSVCYPNDLDMEPHPYVIRNLKSWKSLQESIRGFLAIQPTLLGFALSHLFCHRLPLQSTGRFLLEFVLIAVPTVVFNTVGSEYSDVYCGLVGLVIILQLRYSKFWQKISKNWMYKVGKRPAVFTLLRSTAYIGTCCGILAVDFLSYPVEYRKSRTFGASVMDMGIGLFVVTMGMVSHRLRNLSDLKKLAKVVGPLLVLGLARTIVISMIDYNQDEHEYGKHLNAFFTLGLTKLLGSLFSLFASNDGQVLYLGGGLLILHEVVLQFGLSDFVMSEMVYRKDFFRANREGLSSLPGCIALYLLSIYFAKWYASQESLTFEEILSKFKKMIILIFIGWLFVILSAFTLGIARVTFSSGYVVWIFTICVTLILIYGILFEFAWADISPAPDLLLGEGDKAVLANNSLPAVVETLNMNGLCHFMLSNFLTGFVNIFLQPKERNGLESVLILTIYMLASTTVVYVLYRNRIRIA
ncbi:uncharacterized protein Dwil_GK23935 [Drosophila willistoni]|uniref:Phosphatidylinositol-glycan biosynthesis class W protein n=1 Tax=Drosophila willistoni TaxID=7260 RepID=B4MTZ3_DROWI|nr:uncharacterized protein At4g17910 [Drosophila willistoni]EDW75582.1 uncharacterized protein Dwil_GK23935 [Drosophila willistoni]